MASTEQSKASTAAGVSETSPAAASNGQAGLPEKAAEAASPTAAAAPGVSTEEKKPDPLAKGFAVLTKRERAVAEAKKQLEVAQKKFDEERTAWQKSRDEDAELAKRIEADPLDGIRVWAKRHGVQGDPYEALTRAALRKPKASDPATQSGPVAELRGEIDALKKSIADREAAEQGRIKAEHTAQQQRIIAGHKSEVIGFVRNPEHGLRYEAIIANGSEIEVYNLMCEQYRLDKEEKGDEAEPLSVEKAADILEETIITRLKKLAALKKLQPAPAKTPESGTEATPDSAPPDTRAGKSNADGPRTLTNRNAAQVVSNGGSPPARIGAERRAKERDKIERALKRAGVAK